MLAEGVAKLFAPDFVEGPFPEHYEPAESPVENLLHPEVGSNPTMKVFSSDLDSLGGPEKYPYVAITYCSATNGSGQWRGFWRRARLWR